METKLEKTAQNFAAGSEIIPNITHVFSAAQHLLLYYEVYDTARAAAADSARDAGSARSEESKPGIRLLSNVAFFRARPKLMRVRWWS